MQNPMNTSRRPFGPRPHVAVRLLAIAGVGLLAGCGSGTSDSNAAASQAQATGSSGNLSSGTATLSWTAPLDNTDGSMLTDLAGYHVYYGTDPNNLKQFADVAGASQVVFTANNLTTGTWYFTISAYNTAGTESPYAQIVDTTIG